MPLEAGRTAQYFQQSSDLRSIVRDMSERSFLVRQFRNVLSEFSLASFPLHTKSVRLKKKRSWRVGMHTASWNILSLSICTV